jgi:hypothetical protein
VLGMTIHSDGLYVILPDCGRGAKTKRLVGRKFLRTTMEEAVTWSQTGGGVAQHH